MGSVCQMTGGSTAPSVVVTVSTAADTGPLPALLAAEMVTE